MLFSFSHDEFGSAINAVVRAVPIDDDAIDAAADHVIDLTVDLGGVIRVVAHVHVIGAAKPQHQVGVDFRVCS